MTRTPRIQRIDVLVAAGATAWILLLGLFPDYSALGERSWIVVTILLIQTLSLVLWRRHPLLCQVLVWALQLLLLAVLPGFYATGIAQVVISFCLGMTMPPVRGIALLTILAVSESVVAAVALGLGSWRERADLAFDLITYYVLPFLGGVIVVQQRRASEALREAEARGHEREVKITLAQERRRLAGELHDVAAHHLAGIVVQAAAIERLIDRDPAAAKQAAAQLRGQGKTTLNELRSVVGLLRDNATPAGLRDLPDLVATTAALGVKVELDCPDEPPPLPPETDAAAYRVAQQAISNALQHAPEAWIRVRVSESPGAVELVVDNGPSSRPGQLGTGGTGLALMRERALAVGGELTAGATTGGGWRVQLRLPGEG